MKLHIKTSILEKQHIKSALDISPEEMQVSFMTEFFIFKKIISVNIQDVFIAATKKNKH